MPRDPSGQYNLPPAFNPVVTDTDITVAWGNGTMDDIAIALTDSLDRNGNGGMNVPLPFADGLVNDPGIQWDSEGTSGFYRAASGDTRITIQGTDTMRWFNDGGTRKVQVWDAPAWLDVIDSSSDSLCDPTGATNGQVPTWNGNAWVPQTPASGSTIPNGTANGDTLIWNNNLQVYEADQPAQQIADGTTVARPLGWSGSAWVERGGMTIGLNPGDGATVNGQLTTAGVSSSQSIVVTGGQNVQANDGRLLAPGPSGDCQVRSNTGTTYGLVAIGDSLDAASVPSVRKGTGAFGNGSWGAGLESTADTGPVMDTVRIVSALPGTPDANTLYFVV